MKNENSLSFLFFPSNYKLSTVYIFGALARSHKDHKE